ncbi:Ig-like domain repeat protein, partial [Pseudomonas sp. HY7a-MNA-CIBAN-0227]|uniref:Ig-like domain repeat protein n=1 Tax=Pseudomonas sp. HY7a-MNA-CIBAN-0227 TaxID=3140474 RepID=UPI0033269167
TPIDGSKVFGEITSITGTVTGAIGGTVTVSNGGNVIGTATVDPDGKWELELKGDNALESGKQEITATVSSKAGLTADTIDQVDFTVKPQPPVIDINPNVPKLSEITGTVKGAKAGDEVTVFNGKTELGTATVGENG